MSFTEEVLTAAHRHCSDNRREIERSDVCGCFYCCEPFAPPTIERWLNEGAGTAICPERQIDPLIGSASGYPVHDQSFREAMHQRWFA